MYEQERCAIAKMTAQCALYMGALNIFGTPWLRPWLLYSQHFSWAFVRIDPLNVPTKFEVRSSIRSSDNSSKNFFPQIIVAKIWTVSGYALAPFSRKFLIGFYSDWPYKCTPKFVVRSFTRPLPSPGPFSIFFPFPFPTLPYPSPIAS